MKKRLILGDIHGDFKTVNKIYSKELPDEVILLGDYVDSHENLSDKEQYDAVQNLLFLRKVHCEKHNNFIMLMGNHDFQYYFDNYFIEKYSCYSHKRQKWAGNLFKSLINEGEMQMIYVDKINKTIYSHAGITNVWCTLNSLSINNINDAIITDKYKFQFTLGENNSRIGDSPENSCIWVRPYSLINNMYADYEGNIWTQIVGHTPIKYITSVDTCSNSICDINSANLIFTDCIKSQYLIEFLNDEGKLLKREIKNTN